MEYPTAEGGDFQFGFNNINFSDRVLHLDIIPASLGDDAKNSVVKKLHVSSLMLAAKSQYFFKLFNTGMGGGSQRMGKVPLELNASDEAAFMELLKFMYGIPVTASSASDLVDVLIVADKFAVPSCVKHCVELLQKHPLTTKDAVMYLDLPSSVWDYTEVQTLYDNAEQYLSDHFTDFRKYEEEAIDLTLSAIKIILNIDGLQVYSEDSLVNFILKWSLVHYPELKERQEILMELITQYTYLQNVSSYKLKELVDCAVFGTDQALELLLSAINLKDQVFSNTEYDSPRRVYEYKLIKVVQLQLAQPSCFVYFDLTKEECEAAANRLPSKALYSEYFCVGEQTFFLYTLAVWKLGGGRALNLYIRRKAPDSTNCTLDIQFEVMMKSSKDFQCVVKSNNTSIGGFETIIFSDPFGVPWADFMSDYFIDGILHLRAMITIVD